MKLTKEQRKEMAWKEYEKSRKTAWKEYEKIRDIAYKEYQKIENPAFEEYLKKIKEIEDEQEEIPEIIEQNGRKYRLVEE